MSGLQQRSGNHAAHHCLANPGNGASKYAMQGGRDHESLQDQAGGPGWDLTSDHREGTVVDAVGMIAQAAPAAVVTKGFMEMG